MSFLISTNRLFVLTQSSRLHKLLRGKFKVQVLHPPITFPFRCSLSSETIERALDAALVETTTLPRDWEKERESFVQRLRRRVVSDVVTRTKPTVHAELAMIMAMDKGEIEDIFPYIGVSKLSCIMCNHYIGAFNEATERKVMIATNGSHRKAYPGWYWPDLPNRDEELRPVFLKCMRQQLLNDFEDHAQMQRSDSSVGSGGPIWAPYKIADEMEKLNAELKEMGF
jgi:OTT_1508-like deaminase